MCSYTILLITAQEVTGLSPVGVTNRKASQMGGFSLQLIIIYILYIRSILINIQEDFLYSKPKDTV